MKKFVLLLALISFGCASTQHPAVSKAIEPAGKVLRISVEPVNDYSDDTNIYLDFALENEGTRWIRVDKVAIDFPTETHVIHNVIVGDDLKTWGESLANKERVDHQNSVIATSAMMVGGLAVALLGAKNGESGLAAFGLLTSATGAGIRMAQDIHDSRRKAETSFKVPENYLLAPFVIPSHGLLRRWLLVNVPEKMMARKAILTLTTVEGEKYSYEVPIDLSRPSF